MKTSPVTRPAIRAVLILSLLSVACGAAGPAWTEILSVGLKIGRCVVRETLPGVWDKSDAGADAAAPAPDAGADAAAPAPDAGADAAAPDAGADAAALSGVGPFTARE